MTHRSEPMEQAIETVGLQRDPSMKVLEVIA
jgi:hypothetical protein